MKILICDDEVLIRNVIKEYLQLENIEALEAANGLEAIEVVKNNDVDLVIMDIMMPELDGYQAVREIKKIKDVPFIMLSARNEEFDKLIGFDMGIDDYVTKPFSPKELIARIKAVTKRVKSDGATYKFESLVLDDLAHEVTIDGKIIDLTPK